MSAPRTKRQYAGAASDHSQRQITSFFSASSPSPPALQIAIPEILGPFDASDRSVQANLLSVGMRVRKAVPEGYKTRDYSAFALWDDSGDGSAQMGFVNGEAGRQRANAISTPRELSPFCGIHKIGGLSAQPSLTANSAVSTPLIRVNDVDSMDDVPGLTLSQESVDSTTSTISTRSSVKSRKRSYSEEDDEPVEIPAQLNIAGWQDGEVSPRSFTPVGWKNDRVMAVPRKGRARGKNKTGTDGFGQENVMVVDGDFEEASFLDRTWEVEMSDV